MASGLARERRPIQEALFTLAALAPFGAAAAYLYFQKGASYDAFIFGSGSWGLGCLVKLALYHGIIRRLSHSPSRIGMVSTLNGLVSGVSELGIALAVFVYMPDLSFWDLIAFGVGIGAFEAFLVTTWSTSSLLKGTTLEAPARELEATIGGLSGGRRLLYSYALPITERLIAAVIHIGTRGLVYAGYRAATPVPFIIALAAFTLADGVVGYRLLHQGRLRDLATLNRTYAVLATIALLTLAAFLLSWNAAILQGPEADPAAGI